MSQSVHVVGVGMIPFTQPGASEPYSIMAAKAASEALKDAGLSYQEIQQVYAGYVFGDSACGQAAVYKVGLTGIPIINVNNSCATGSTALFLARQAIESGGVDCVLVLGFEQMTREPIKPVFVDREDPAQRFLDAMQGVQGLQSDAPHAAQLLGAAARVHMKMFGTRPETFAQIAVKARQHAAHNPQAVFRNPISLEQVMRSPTIFAPLTRLQCGMPACGAAAAVLCSPAFAKKHGLDMRVRIAAQAMSSDTNTSFDEGDMRKLVGFDMTRNAARQVYERSGVGPEDVELCELDDCFTANELLSYEALGLTPEGGAERFVLAGDNTYGGRIVTNPSGGLLSRGHPPGATGLAQCAELVWQLRGQAGPRQVAGARTALQHNLGLGGACVVTLYQAY